MTDLELLSACINELGRISVPTVYVEQIGIPVYNVRQKLISLYKSVSELSKPQEEPEPEVQEPENAEPVTDDNIVQLIPEDSETPPEE